MSGHPELKPFRMEWLDKRGNFYSLITPEMAVDLLALNSHNRTKKPTKINQYAKDMAAGKWHPDASDLKFSEDKILLDGQNRLVACIQADVPFGTLVRTGLDPNAQPHMDTGSLRTLADVFKMSGVSDPNNVAAAISLRTRYESIVESGQTIIEKRLPLTRQEALDYLTEHPQAEKLTGLASSMQRVAPGIQRSVFLAALSMFAEQDEPLARQVASKFIAGDIQGTGDPLLALTRFAASVMTPAEQKLGHKRTNAGIRNLTALVKTWNAVAQGAKMDKLVVREDEKPEPIMAPTGR